MSSTNQFSTTSQDASGRQPSAASSTAAQLASAQISLRKTLREFPDFPIPGIDFVDIMPLFANPEAHATLLSALELQIAEAFGANKPDVIVGLDARGFLFGPGLALRLGVPFAAVRKQGKLPGPCVTAEYIKEYGKDLFQMQADAITEGQKVLVVDDIIATGMSIALFCGPIGPLDVQKQSEYNAQNANFVYRWLGGGSGRSCSPAQGPGCWLPFHFGDSRPQRS
jgi:adenine phosphoribosyltransferase